ncbi:MAG TPA: hypothetical protein VF477_00360 [Mycobacterium sp.]
MSRVANVSCASVADHDGASLLRLAEIGGNWLEWLVSTEAAGVGETARPNRAGPVKRARSVLLCVRWLSDAAVTVPLASDARGQILAFVDR